LYRIGETFLEQAEVGAAECGEGRGVPNLEDDGVKDLVGHVEERDWRSYRKSGGGGKDDGFGWKLRR
jgi:hypothetical protein